jgi:hypothetical protein
MLKEAAMRARGWSLYVNYGVEGGVLFEERFVEIRGAD